VPIQTRCPGCNIRIELPPNVTANQFACPKCNTIFNAPPLQRQASTTVNPGSILGPPRAEPAAPVIPQSPVKLPAAQHTVQPPPAAPARTVQYVCPSCKTPGVALGDQAGSKIACHACGQRIQLPSLSALNKTVLALTPEQAAREAARPANAQPAAQQPPPVPTTTGVELPPEIIPVAEFDHNPPAVIPAPVVKPAPAQPDLPTFAEIQAQVANLQITRASWTVAGAVLPLLLLALVIIFPPPGWVSVLFIFLALLASPGLGVTAWLYFRDEVNNACYIRDAVMARDDLTWEKIREDADRRRAEVERMRREERRQREQERRRRQEEMEERERRVREEREEKERRWREDYRRALADFRCPYCGRGLHFLHERVDGRRDMRYNYNPPVCHPCGEKF
jgi:hypothetical protein